MKNWSQSNVDGRGGITKKTWEKTIKGWTYKTSIKTRKAATLKKMRFCCKNKLMSGMLGPERNAGRSQLYKSGHSDGLKKERIAILADVPGAWSYKTHPVLFNLKNLTSGTEVKVVTFLRSWLALVIIPCKALSGMILLFHHPWLLSPPCLPQRPQCNVSGLCIEKCKYFWKTGNIALSMYSWLT